MDRAVLCLHHTYACLLGTWQHRLYLRDRIRWRKFWCTNFRFPRDVVSRWHPCRNRVKKLTKHFCKIRVFRVSMYASALMGLSIYFLVGQGEFVAAVICYFLYCFLTDLNTPIFWALISEVSDYGKKKTGIDSSGISMGAISFCQKLGMGLSGIVTGYTLQYFGYSADAEKTQEVLEGLSLSLSITPAIFFLITGLIMRKYIITTDYYNSMMSKPEDGVILNKH